MPSENMIEASTARRRRPADSVPSPWISAMLAPAM